MIALPVLVLVSVLVVLAACIAALALPLRGSIERAAAAILTAHALVTASLLVAGVGLRSLDPFSIAIVAIVACGIVVALSIRREPARLLRVARATAGDIVTGSREALRVVPVAILGVVAVASLAWRTVLAIRLPVLDYDGFSYHLVTVDAWLQSGLISRTPQRFWSDGYPANGELLTLWLMAFTRTDDLATLTGLISVPLAIVSTIGLARVLGAGRPWAVMAGLLMAVTPALVVLTTTTYVDIPTVAYLAAGWYFGLSALLARDGPRRNALLALAGVACGVGMGTKATLLLPLGVMATALVVDVVRRSPRIGWALVRNSALVVVPVLLLGAYWYVKNIIVFGNPIWPFKVGPLPGVGTVDELIVQTPKQMASLAPLGRVLFSWFADPGLSNYAYDTRIGGFGIQWAGVLALGLLGGFMALRRRHWPVLLIVGPAVLTLLTMPMSWWPRLTLFVPLAAVALAAVALSRLSQARPVGRAIATVAAAGLVLAASASLWVATAHFNVAIRPGTAVGPTLSSMISLAEDPGTKRADLGWWATCADLRSLPPGARVSQDDFNLLHLVTGHTLQEVALQSIGPVSGAADLRSQASALGADHLLLTMGGPASQAAMSDPAHFTFLGPACGVLDMVQVR